MRTSPKPCTRAFPRRRYAFLTLPNYSMIAHERRQPLRMANRLAGRRSTRGLSYLDGAPVLPSNGLSFSPTAPLNEMGPVDVVFVCGGVDVQRVVTKDLPSRCAARQHRASAGSTHRRLPPLGAPSTSTARRSTGRTCPRCGGVSRIVAAELFAIDRDRYLPGASRRST
jgi:hypothetical protein